MRYFVSNHVDGEERAGCFTLSSWCLKIAVWLFLTLSWVGLKFVIVVFPDHTHLLFLMIVSPDLEYIVRSIFHCW